MSHKLNTKLVNQLNQIQKKTKSESFQLENILFDKQLEMINDKARFKVVTCSRRAGKSFSLICYLIRYGLDNPYHTLLYIMSTKTRAVKVIWRELQRFNEVYQLNLKFDNSKHEVKYPNGTLLILGGIKDEGEMDGHRGISPSPSLIVVDEAGHTTSLLATFITEVATPALLDYGGTLILIGTPNPLCQGAFHDAFHQKDGFRQFKPFHWTFFENPKIPRILNGEATHEEIFNEICENSGLPPDHPSILREYKGRWIKDVDSLVYSYDGDRNKAKIKELDKSYKYILGVDTGFVDNCGYAVLAYSEEFSTAYVVEAFERDFKDATSIIDEVNRLNETYNFTRIVFDPAAGGKTVMGELYLRYKLMGETAEKVKKAQHISLLNADLRKGTLQIFEEDCRELVFAWSHMTWKRKANGENVINSFVDKIKIDHCVDAALYAWRCCSHYRYQRPEKETAFGTPEYFKKVADEHFNRVLEETNKEIKQENSKFIKSLSKRRRF